VPPDEWEAARQQLLEKEKELTRARDALAAERLIQRQRAPGRESKDHEPINQPTKATKEAK